MSESVLPMFSSRSWIISGLTFRSLIHFEFVFVYGVRKCSSFIRLQVVDQFSLHHLLKRLSFLHCIFLPPLSKIRCTYVWVYLWAFYSVPLSCISLCVPVPYCLDDCGFAVETEVRQPVSQIHYSFSRLLWLLKIFCISIQIVKLFVLALWKIPLVAWLHWIYRFLCYSWLKDFYVLFVERSYGEDWKPNLSTEHHRIKMELHRGGICVNHRSLWSFPRENKDMVQALANCCPQRQGVTVGPSHLQVLHQWIQPTVDQNIWEKNSKVPKSKTWIHCMLANINKAVTQY